MRLRVLVSALLVCLLSAVTTANAGNPGQGHPPKRIPKDVGLGPSYVEFTLTPKHGSSDVEPQHTVACTMNVTAASYSTGRATGHNESLCTDYVSLIIAKVHIYMDSGLGYYEWRSSATKKCENTIGCQVSKTILCDYSGQEFLVYGEQYAYLADHIDTSGAAWTEVVNCR